VPPSFVLLQDPGRLGTSHEPDSLVFGQIERVLVLGRDDVSAAWYGGGKSHVTFGTATDPRGIAQFRSMGGFEYSCDQYSDDCR